MFKKVKEVLKKISKPVAKVTKGVAKVGYKVTKKVAKVGFKIVKNIIKALFNKMFRDKVKKLTKGINENYSSYSKVGMFLSKFGRLKNRVRRDITKKCELQSRA